MAKGILVNDLLLKQFALRICEFCGKPGGSVHAHHVIPRGGGRRYDSELNLIAVHDWACHETLARLPRMKQLEYVSKRLGISVDVIETRLNKAIYQRSR